MKLNEEDYPSSKVRLMINNETLRLARKRAEGDGVSMTQVINRILAEALGSKDIH